MILLACWASPKRVAVNQSPTEPVKASSLETRCVFRLTLHKSLTLQLEQKLSEVPVVFKAYSVTPANSAGIVEVTFEAVPKDHYSHAACLESLQQQINTALQGHEFFTHVAREQNCFKDLPASADSYGKLAESPCISRANHRKILRKKFRSL